MNPIADWSHAPLWYVVYFLLKEYDIKSFHKGYLCPRIPTDPRMDRETEDTLEIVCHTDYLFVKCIFSQERIKFYPNFKR